MSSESDNLDNDSLSSILYDPSFYLGCICGFVVSFLFIVVFF